MPGDSQPLAGQKAFVLTVSDRCFAGTQTDVSGPAIVQILTGAGAAVVSAHVVPDERPLIATILREAAVQANLLVTTGGTGVAPRDVTPEATLEVCDRLVPGLAELIRLEGTRRTPFAAPGRGICGTLGGALILNLPGSPAGAETSLRAVLPLLPHALDLLAGKATH